MKLRLKGAQKGHSLLKKKADALTLRFRQILRKIIDVSISECQSKAIDTSGRLLIAGNWDMSTKLFIRLPE